MLHYREELAKPIALHIFVTLVPVALSSWLVLSLAGIQDILIILLITIILTVITLGVGAIMGLRLVLGLFHIRWVNKDNDVILWSLVNGESAKAKVTVDGVGIIELDTPNAFVAADIQGKPVFLYTRGLLYHLTYNELRAVTTYLLGSSKSGLLPHVTILSGLQSIGTRLASGYIEGRVKKRSSNILRTILGGWGYLYFSTLNHQTTSVGKDMVHFSELYSLENASNAEYLLTALFKISYLLGIEDESYMRTGAIGLKALMFQDPSLSLRDRVKLRELVAIQNLQLDKLMGNISVGPVSPSKDNLHMFEKYWVHSGLEERIGKIIEAKEKT
jgi:Zn-dependent protease with chaperone function